jgi:uncharacterized membrane protein YfcA
MLIILSIGFIVGAFGAMLGIGGGILLIPLLTGFCGVPIKMAIGTSILCVIATSCGAGVVYIGRGLTHNRLAMVLEIATTAGALTGGVTAVVIRPFLLTIFFGFILVYVAFSMRKLPKEDRAVLPTGVLDTSYVDPSTGNVVSYGIRNLPFGMGASFLAGNISGLLGIGGGIIKVPIMSLVMGVPLRASIATSNFMIGITAATSAIIYYGRGYIDPTIAIPTALGVLAGAQVGTRLGGRLRSQKLTQVFQWHPKPRLRKPQLVPSPFAYCTAYGDFSPHLK